MPNGILTSAGIRRRNRPLSPPSGGASRPLGFGVLDAPADLDMAWDWEHKNLPAESWAGQSGPGVVPGVGTATNKEIEMDRREFTKVMGAVAAGMLAGSQAFAADEKKDAKAADKHVCKGDYACKGQGADGKNACKGKGGCAVPPKMAEKKS